jgi:uncharacterized Tic20 family protein
MTDRIPPKFRYLAAIHHLIFAIVTFPIVIIPLVKDNPQINNLESVISILIYAISLPLIIPLFSVLLWRLTRKIHPFVDLAGMDTTSYTMNHLVVLLIILFINFTLCSVSAVSTKGSFSGATYSSIGAIIVYCVETTYFVNSVVCAIFALRGYRFKNKFLRPFTREG